MGLSLHPNRLRQYSEIAQLLFKYGREDLVTRAGLDDALRPEDATPSPGAPDPRELAADLANGITLGLLLASLIIGAAMLMRVDTAFRLFGYPGFAMLFFLVAAAGGVWLAWNILKSDRPARGGR